MKFNEVIRSKNFVILDTETTGLHDGEIVQIAVIDPEGTPLLNTLVKSVYPIPPAAQAVHGISDEMVKGAPGWEEIVPALVDILMDQNVVVYNATYDRKMMHQSSEKARLPKIEWKNLSRWWCAMEAYAQHWGDWNDYYQSYRWQKLAHACEQQKLDVYMAHSALGDCLMTLALVNKCFGQSEPETK